ncbi:MAG TPA: hypothetical protein VIX86_03610 [Streptosporangiaceae bacterium]
MNVTEADVVVWTGALAAFAGTFIASPAGTAYVAKRFAGRVGHAASWAIRHLTRRGHAAVVAVPDDGKGTFSDEASVRVEPYMSWDADAHLAEKVDRLHQQLEQVLAHVTLVRLQGQQQATTLRASLAKGVSDRHTGQQKLTNRLDATEIQSAKIDARGVILIGASVVMTSIPGAIAYFAPVGAVVIALVLYLTGRFAWKAIGDGLRMT